jgi:hypothetical protein
MSMAEYRRADLSYNGIKVIATYHLPPASGTGLENSSGRTSRSSEMSGRIPAESAL